MGGLDDGAFKLIVTSPPCNLGKASLAAKPEQRVVEIVHPSYQPSKVALEEDMRVDARFEEAVDALAQPVSTRHIARPKPGHQAASGTFLHNPLSETRRSRLRGQPEAEGYGLPEAGRPGPRGGAERLVTGGEAPGAAVLANMPPAPLPEEEGVLHDVYKAVPRSAGGHPGRRRAPRPLRCRAGVSRRSRPRSRPCCRPSSATA